MKKLLLAVAISSICVSSFAQEAPAAASLVGKFYGGIHASYLNNDSDRNVPNMWYHDVIDGLGYGVDLGYRATERLELRFSYTDFDLNYRDDSLSPMMPDSNIFDLDALYFPMEGNFYLLGGLSSVDIKGREASINLGAGYRHYLTDNLSMFVEGKGYHDVSSNDFDDLTASLGVTYFFGEINAPKASVEPAPEVKPAVESVALVDTDGDGVYDNEDNCANSDPKYKVDVMGCTVYSDQERTVNLLINFANNSSIVSPNYMEKISELADFMKQYPETSVVIEGHTSAAGSAKYNLMLSEKRAKAVAAILVDKFGIDSTRVKAEGYGETRLLDNSNTPEAHAKNRRIQAVISTTTKMPVEK